MDETSTSNNYKEKKQVPLSIYQYDAELALAFQADCEDFLQRFSNLKTASFVTFSNLWKETCFISVFERQDFLLMLQTFLENCFFIVKKFFNSPDIYKQTGSFYLLYALYYKQPVREWIKIRLIQSEADKLNELVEHHKRNESWEFVFTYNKMRLDGAFHYCALAQPLGLEAKFLKRQDLTGETTHKKHSSESPLQKFKNLMEQDCLLPELTETDKEYHNLVNKYKEKCKQLYVFPSEINDDLSKAYNAIFNTSLNNPKEQDRLTEIKSRAMTTTNARYRAERTLVVGTDYDKFEASCSNSK